MCLTRSVLLLVLVQTMCSDIVMLPPTLQYFGSGTRIICEKLKTAKFDERFNLLTCDVTSFGDTVTQCVVVATASQNVSINWFLATIHGSSDPELNTAARRYLMLVNVNYCDLADRVEQSLESNVIVRMTLIRALSSMDCPTLDGSVMVKDPGANVVELPLEGCSTLIETWADYDKLGP